MTNILCIKIKNKKGTKECTEKQRGIRNTLHYNLTISNIDIKENKYTNRITRNQEYTSKKLKPFKSTTTRKRIHS
jgi:hypothetical protein